MRQTPDTREDLPARMLLLPLCQRLNLGLERIHARIGIPPGVAQRRFVERPEAGPQIVEIEKPGTGRDPCLRLRRERHGVY